MPWSGLHSISLIRRMLINGLFSRNPARPLEKQDWWTILALGLVGYYASSLLDFLGLRYISAGLERLILFLRVYELGLAHVFLGESFALQQILGSMLVMAGVLAISLKPRGA